MVAAWKLPYYARAGWQYMVTPAAKLGYLPEDISVEATNVCNFKCKFCAQSDPDHFKHIPRIYLSPETATKILSRVREAGVRTDTLHWTLDGETFMNKRFIELCEVAVRFSFHHMWFATNGLLCTPENLHRLPQARYTFTIDYAADEAYFEEVRGTKGSWDAIRSNILHILTSSQLAHIALVVTDMSSYRIRDEEKLAGSLAALTAMFPASARLTVRSKTFHNGAGTVAAPAGAKLGGKYHLCPYPWITLNVTSSGDVVACCRDLNRQTVLGNILETPLLDIWNGGAFQELRRNLINQKPELVAACNGCDMPYNAEKFSLRNLVRTATGRLQILPKLTPRLKRPQGRVNSNSQP